MAALLMTPVYNANKPVNYSILVGLGTTMTSIPQIQNAVSDFVIRFTNLYNASYPSATWEF